VTSSFGEELEAAGIALIRVQPKDKLESDLAFDGERSEFIDAIKRIGSQAVFLQEHKLPDDFYIYRPHEDDALDAEPIEDDEDVAEGDGLGAPSDAEIDLRTIDSSLRQFQKYVGHVYSRLVAAPVASSLLYYRDDESWYEQMEDAVVSATERAREKLENAAEERLQRGEELRARREQEVNEEIRQLRDDPEFEKTLSNRRVTLRALVTAARSRSKVLKALEPKELQRMIQTLRDELQYG